MSQTVCSQYEMVVLIRPEFEAKIDKPLKTIADIIENNGGRIINQETWGRRELAYKIANDTHAVYNIYRLELPATAPAKIDATLNITDSVIRHLITKVDEKIEAVIAAEKQARKDREANRFERSEKDVE